MYYRKITVRKLLFNWLIMNFVTYVERDGNGPVDEI